MDSKHDVVYYNPGNIASETFVRTQPCTTFSELDLKLFTNGIERETYKNSSYVRTSCKQAAVVQKIVRIGSDKEGRAFNSTLCTWRTTIHNASLSKEIKGQLYRSNCPNEMTNPFKTYFPPWLGWTKVMSCMEWVLTSKGWLSLSFFITTSLTSTGARNGTTVIFPEVTSFNSNRFPPCRDSLRREHTTWWKAWQKRKEERMTCKCGSRQGNVAQWLPVNDDYGSHLCTSSLSQLLQALGSQIHSLHIRTMCK